MLVFPSAHPQHVWHLPQGHWPGLGEQAKVNRLLPRQNSTLIFDHSFGMDDQPEPRFAFSLPDLSRKPPQPEPPFGSKKTDEVGKDALDWAKRHNPFEDATRSASTFGQDANKENASGNFFPKMENQTNGLNETNSFNNRNDDKTNNNNAELEEQHSGFLGYCAYFLRRYVD